MSQTPADQAFTFADMTGALHLPLPDTEAQRRARAFRLRVECRPNTRYPVAHFTGGGFVEHRNNPQLQRSSKFVAFLNYADRLQPNQNKRYYLRELNSKAEGAVMGQRVIFVDRDEGGPVVHKDQIFTNREGGGLIQIFGQNVLHLQTLLEKKDDEIVRLRSTLAEGLVTQSAPMNWAAPYHGVKNIWAMTALHPQHGSAAELSELANKLPRWATNYVDLRVRVLADCCMNLRTWDPAWGPYPSWCRMVNPMPSTATWSEVRRLISIAVHGANMRDDAVLMGLDLISGRMENNGCQRVGPYLKEIFEKVMYQLEVEDAVWLVRYADENPQSLWNHEIDLIDRYLTMANMIASDRRGFARQHKGPIVFPPRDGMEEAAAMISGINNNDHPIFIRWMKEVQMLVKAYRTTHEDPEGSRARDLQRSADRAHVWNRTTQWTGILPVQSYHNLPQMSLFDRTASLQFMAEF